MVDSTKGTSDPKVYEREKKLSKGVIGLLVVFALLGVGAVGFVVSGFYNIGITAGHTYVTKQLIVLTRQRSVAFHSDDAPPPAEELASAALVERGAAHYAHACQNCHGAPGQEPAAYSEHMLPRPPHLQDGELLSQRSDEELFWVLKNGIKLANMPAWPEPERDSDPWAMVAFLRKLPELTPKAYRELSSNHAEHESHAGVAQLSSAQHALVEECAQCHGYDGLGRGSGAFPNLTLLDEKYLRGSLIAYQEGTRHSGFMKSQVRNLTTQQMDWLASYYSNQPKVYAGDPGARADLVDTGRHIAGTGIPEREIASCTSCHGVLEVTETKVDDEVLYYPQLAGQYAAYLRNQLYAWDDNDRGGIHDEDPEVDAAHQLEPNEIEAVAAFYASRDEVPEISASR